MKKGRLQEIVNIAKEKAKTLAENCQIKVTPVSGENYYIYNKGGSIFIGYPLSEPMNKVYKNRTEYTLYDGSTGEEIAKLQKLFL